MEIEKQHTCPECKHYHGKLHMLADHLKRTRHFPAAKSGAEITVLHCPFDKCFFKSDMFFSFKKHLLTHKFFIGSPQAPAAGERVVCKVHVYTAPRAYLHVTRFGEGAGTHSAFEAEREAEKSALADLLEFHKNQDLAHVNADIKERRDYLVSMPGGPTRSAGGPHKYYHRDHDRIRE